MKRWVNMALSTKAPPVIHCTETVPLQGMVNRRPETAVALQNNHSMSFTEVTDVSNDRLFLSPSLLFNFRAIIKLLANMEKNKNEGNTVCIEIMD